MNMTIDEFLDKCNLTESQKTAKVYGVIKQALIDDEISSSETAKQELQEIDHNVRNLKYQVNTARADISKLLEQISGLEVDVSQMRISDNELRDSVNAFVRAIEGAKIVLGDTMNSEAVACQVVESASYIACPKFRD